VAGEAHMWWWGWPSHLGRGPTRGWDVEHDTINPQDTLRAQSQDTNKLFLMCLKLPEETVAFELGGSEYTPKETPSQMPIKPINLNHACSSSHITPLQKPPPARPQAGSNRA